MPRPRKLKPPKRHERGWGAGSIREVRPGVWRATRARQHQPDGTVVRTSRTFAGPDAQAQAAEWAGGEPEHAVLLLGVWLSRWLALRRPTLAPKTYINYRTAVLACAPLAGRPLASLTVDDWQTLTNSLLQRWSRTTVAVWRSSISGALNAAIPTHLTSNPLSRVRLPKPAEQPPKAWTQAELDRALVAAQGGTHEAWLLFSVGTGVRLGEARGLLWKDVDLQAMTATIRQSADNVTGKIGPTKTGRVRVIDVPEELRPVLDEHRKRQRPSERYVFPISSNALRRWLSLICRDARITRITPHGLRHCYASIALDAGVPIQDIARQLGHTVKTCQTTYAHFIGQGQRRAANALGAALRNRFSGPKLAMARGMARDGRSDQEG